MSGLKLAIGTACFPLEKLQQALDVIKSVGIVEVDSAESYGSNEADLGNVGAGEQGFVISTKNSGGFVPGHLKDLKQSTEASLGKLKLQQVDILYIHGPDKTMKPADWAHDMDALHKAGKFKRFGISNFTPEQTRELHAYCKENSLVLPTIYQGNYNAVARHTEATLLPVLRELGIVFYAYSPIAGGFLTKSRKALEAGTEGGRFAVNDDRLNQLYRGLYLKPALLEGLEKWEDLAKSQGVSQAELAYRWVYYHGHLKPENGDHLIVGAAKPEQITQTVEGLKKGPLNAEVVEGINEVWEIVKHQTIVDNFNGGTGVLLSD